MNLAIHILELANWYYNADQKPEWVTDNSRDALCKAIIAFGMADGDENEEDMINEAGLWAFELGVKTCWFDEDYDGSYLDVAKALRKKVQESK